MPHLHFFIYCMLSYYYHYNQTIPKVSWLIYLYYYYYYQAITAIIFVIMILLLFDFFELKSHYFFPQETLVFLWQRNGKDFIGYRLHFINVFQYYCLCNTLTYAYLFFNFIISNIIEQLLSAEKIRCTQNHENSVSISYYNFYHVFHS